MIVDSITLDQLQPEAVWFVIVGSRTLDQLRPEAVWCVVVGSRALDQLLLEAAECSCHVQDYDQSLVVQTLSRLWKDWSWIRQYDLDLDTDASHRSDEAATALVPHDGPTS